MGIEPDIATPPAKSVAVLGGGLSGLSAALRSLKHGFQVTLVEKRPFLGGRAYSFRDSREGVEVDNGQHVFMGCCRYYHDYLRDVGATGDTYLQPRLRTEVVLDGKTGVISSSALPGRLHLLPSLVGYPHLGVKDKALVIFGLLKIRFTDRAKHHGQLDNQSFYEWLRRSRQSERAIRNLWNLIILPTLNDDVRHVSADMALMIFQEGLLSGPNDAAIGISRVGLTSLNGEPAARRIQERGGVLQMEKAVRSLLVKDGHVSGVELSDGTILKTDAYVSALPFDVLLEVLPEEVSADPFFSRAKALRSAPIVGVHLWYDRPIMVQDFVAFLNSPVQWVFNKSRIQGDDSGPGQYIFISLSGAWEFVDRPKEEIADLFTQEMARLFPKARDARVQRLLVVKEPKATFRSEPGAQRRRLPQQTPITNLFLAGEWTDTGWPSTMEGAVRSGVFAADKVAATMKGNVG